MSILDKISQPVSTVVTKTPTSITTEQRVGLFRRLLTGDMSYKFSVQQTPKYKVEDVPPFVPEQYRPDIAQLANTYDFDPKKVSALLHTENTPWDPKAKNPMRGSTARGLGQHTDAFYQEYNPKFKAQYGRDYDRTMPFDSMAATFLGLSDLRSRLGSEEDAIRAYHAGVKGFQGKYKKQAEEYLAKVMSQLSE